MFKFKIPQDKVGKVIGSGGSTIKEIIEESGVENIALNKPDEGDVCITAFDDATINAAKARIDATQSPMKVASDVIKSIEGIVETHRRKSGVVAVVEEEADEEVVVESKKSAATTAEEEEEEAAADAKGCTTPTMSASRAAVDSTRLPPPPMMIGGPPDWTGLGKPFISLIV